MSNAIADLDTLALAAAIARREVSPVQAVEAALARIEECQRLNAFVTVTAEQARATAQALMPRWQAPGALPPLFGVPFTAKDLTPTAGVRTTMGSKLFADNVPKEDAPAVARLKSAGGILLGKTTTPELGHKAFTQSKLFGRTLNPWNADYTCGGSSGGAGVAALMGMAPLALGTDGGGSIRIPAACSGIVGLKPTLGAIPQPQSPDLFGTNSFIGPMARTVAEVEFAWTLLRGTDRMDPWGQSPLPNPSAKPLAGLRVAYLPRCGSPAIDPEVAASTESAANHLRDLGAVVEEIELDFYRFEAPYLVMLQSSVAARIAPFLKDRRNDMEESLAITAELGLKHSAVALQGSAAARSELFRLLQGVFSRFDVMLSPVMAAPPLPVETDPHGHITINGVDCGTIRGGWYPFTFPMNLTGHPAMSQPAGLSRHGTPLSVQLCGPWHSEATLLATAAALEAKLPKLARPPI
ncbi:MAG: amidase family protein [Alphaproteobacteria bacterium]|nr:amidase family protein [Alphaproteobacteria bacterium]